MDCEKFQLIFRSKEDALQIIGAAALSAHGTLRSGPRHRILALDGDIRDIVEVDDSCMGTASKVILEKAVFSWEDTGRLKLPLFPFPLGDNT